MSVIIYFVTCSIMSSATFAMGRGQSSDVIIEVVLQLCSQTSILAAMEQHAGFSVISSRACHVTVHGYAMFDTVLNYIIL